MKIENSKHPIDDFYKFLDNSKIIYESKIHSIFEEIHIKQGTYYSISKDNNIFRNILTKLEVPENEIKEFLEKKYLNDTLISYKLVVLYALYKRDLKNSASSFKLNETVNEILDLQVSSLAYKITSKYLDGILNNDLSNKTFQNFIKKQIAKKDKDKEDKDKKDKDFDFRKVSLPNLNDISDIEEEIKIFFIEKLGFSKGKPELTIYEAYKVFKSPFLEYSPIKDHLVKNKMLLSNYTNTKHITKLATLLIEKNPTLAEKIKELKTLIKQCFRNNFTETENKEDISENDSLETEVSSDNKDNPEDIKEELSEHKIFELLYSKLKEKYNIELNIDDFYEAQKYNPNLSSTSLDNLMENDKAITIQPSESKAELDYEQALVLDVLFKFFARDTNKNKVYRRKLYLLFLEYILEMEGKEISNALNTSTATITQAKEDLLSDLFYLTDSKIDKYLEEWFKKDILKVDKKELKEKINFFDKQASNYKDNLKSYFLENTKNNLPNNILYFINGLTVLKTKKALEPLIREIPNIQKEILQKVDIGKGNIDNQIEMYIKNLNQNFDKEIIAKIKLLFKQFDKEILLKEISNLKDDDLDGFLKRSKEIIQSNFHFIPKLYFSKLENSSNITETFNKDTFFLLASLFINNKIKNEGKDFEQIKLSFNSFDNFKDFLLENPIEVPRKFSSSLIVEDANKIIFSELKEIYHG